MRRLAILLAVLFSMTALVGCKNSMRIAHSMVEAEGIAHDLKSMERATAGADADNGGR